MLELIGPRGLGDALLVRAVALEWIKRGQAVKVHTKWPDVFSDLPLTVSNGLPYRNGQVDVYNCMSCMQCRRPEMAPLTMFTRTCHQSGLFDPVELRLDWKVRDQSFLDKIKRRANGKPILIYQPPKLTNGGEQELYTPPADAFNNWLLARDDYYRIKVGHPSAAMEFRDAPCELNLFNKTSVRQMIDLATIGDLFFSQVCFLPTLAEAMDKKSVCMFTRRQLAAGTNWVRAITPDVFFHKKHLGEAVYVD